MAQQTIHAADQQIIDAVGVRRLQYVVDIHGETRLEISQLGSSMVARHESPPKRDENTLQCNAQWHISCIVFSWFGACFYSAEGCGDSIRCTKNCVRLVASNRTRSPPEMMT